MPNGPLGREVEHRRSRNRHRLGNGHRRPVHACGRCRAPRQRGLGPRRRSERKGGHERGHGQTADQRQSPADDRQAAIAAAGGAVDAFGRAAFPPGQAIRALEVGAGEGTGGGQRLEGIDASVEQRGQVRGSARIAAVGGPPERRLGGRQPPLLG